MDIVRSWRDVPGELKGAALAIGNFDGVHRGHQEVLREANASPRRRDAAPARWCSSRTREPSSCQICRSSG